MSLKLSIQSFDRRFLACVLALIFMLTMAFSNVTLSEESQAGKEEVLRKASLRWMQVGIQQYKGDLFTESELSFRRALVFQKYLTAAEREQLVEFLANARIAMSEGKQAAEITQTAAEPVEPDQPVKAAVTVAEPEETPPPAQQASRQTTQVIEKKSEQPAPQDEQPAEAAEPAISEIQVTAGHSGGLSMLRDGTFTENLTQLSSWLTENRGNILMIFLPILAVLVLILKLQARRKLPGRRVYTNRVVQNSSIIGNNLNGRRENRRPAKRSKRARSVAPVVEKPKRKSFRQSTDHWHKEPAGLTPAARKSFRTNENWPQPKDKFEDEKPAEEKAEQKQCGKCGEFKDLTEFHKDKSCKDGLARWCKECKAAAAKQSRKKRAARENRKKRAAKKTDKK